MKSLVLIIPSQFQNEANALSVALGYDTPPGNTYSVPLSPTGTGEPTHFGTHTWATDSFINLIGSAANGSVPDYFPAEVISLVNTIIPHLSIFPDDAISDYSNNWENALSTLGLVVIPPPTLPPPSGV